jgi:hypothetical protein
MSKFDKEYIDMVNLAKQKVAAAALLLKEAEGFLEKTNHTLYNLYDENYNEVMAPVWEQLDNIGWSTSSLSC